MIKVALTAADYKAASYLSIPWRRYWIFGGLAFAYGVLIGWAARFEAIWWPVIGASFVAIFFAIIFGFLGLAIRRKYRNNPMLQYEMTYSWDDAGLHVRFVNGETRYPWSDILTYKEGPETLIVVPALGLMLILPKRCFEAPDQIDEFRAVLQRQTFTGYR